MVGHQPTLVVFCCLVVPFFGVLGWGRLKEKEPTQKWGNNLAVRIPKAFAKDLGIEQGVIPDGEAIHGLILADQVKSLDWKARRIRVAGKAPHGVVLETLDRFAALLA